MNRRGHCGRVDGNHAEIVKVLRQAAIGAVSTASVGGGFPDIAASWRGVNVLLEVKQPGEKLTAAEVKFHETWPGQVAIVYSPDEAINAVLKAAGAI